MKKKRAASAARYVLASFAAILVVAGCHKVTGGGWIDGVNGGKATFGFQAQCVKADPFGSGDAWWQYEGQFQFNDRSAGVRFHGDINIQASSFIEGQPLPDTCEESVELTDPDALNVAFITGTCRSPGGVLGSFSVEVVDNGTPGSLAGDQITVQTPILGFAGTPCTDDGNAYSNSGVIGGGNIVSHGHKDAGSSARKKG